MNVDLVSFERKYFVRHTLSQEEKFGLLLLSRKYEKFPFYETQLANDLEFSSSVKSIFHPGTAQLLSDLAGGESIHTLLLDNLPREYLETTTVSGVSKESKVSETVLLAFASLMRGVAQREETSHQPQLLQQIRPVKGYSEERSGRGAAALPFHVENAFINEPPTILGLYCIEGQKGVKTEVLAVSAILEFLTREVIDALSSPIFTVESGDGFTSRRLHGVPLIEFLEDGWTLSRFYEEDRIKCDIEHGRAAINELKCAIAMAKFNFSFELELTAGQCVLFLNGFSKGRPGGVLHGRSGRIDDLVNGGADASVRWLQRICIDLRNGTGSDYVREDEHAISS